MSNHALELQNKRRTDLHKMKLRFKNDWVLYVMLLPTIIYFILFRVLPIYNMRLAFYTFKAKTPWVYEGLKYFKQIFSSPQFVKILNNTLVISLMKYVLLFPVFVIFAILLNEVRSLRFRKGVQIVSYLPHFLSWPVIAGIWISMLAVDGAVNQVTGWFGATPVRFMTNKGTIRWVLFFSEMWRSLGWDSIIYFTAILGIDNSLYESAAIDGAGRFSIIRYIILPALVAPMTTMFILNLGYFLSAGFDQVLNFSNDSVSSVIDILDTYIYRIGLERGQYSLATAMSVLKGIVGCVLVFLTHITSKKLTGSGVW